MAHEVTFVLARAEHAHELGPRMRPEDVAEVLAGGHASGLAALLRSLELSDVAYAALVDGEVAALFGIVSRGKTLLGDDGTGIVWSLTGRAFAQHPKAFAKRARWALKLLLGHTPVLFSAVDARYAKAVRWVRWLGFRVAPAVPFGPERVPFHPVMIRRDMWETRSPQAS